MNIYRFVRPSDGGCYTILMGNYTGDLNDIIAHNWKHTSGDFYVTLYDSKKFPFKDDLVEQIGTCDLAMDEWTRTSQIIWTQTNSSKKSKQIMSELSKDRWEIKVINGGIEITPRKIS